jgi:hypothetical protein
MKRTVLLPIAALNLLSTGILGSPVAAASSAPSRDALANPDATARLQAVQQIETGVREYVKTIPGSASTSPKRLDDGQINLLIRGLGDESKTVRAECLRALSLILLVAHPTNGQPRPGAPDLTRYPGASEALLKTMADPDPDNRVAAIKIYARLFPVTPELERHWMTAFNEEQSGVRRRHLLTALISSKTRSKQAVNFVVTQLKNPERAYETAGIIMTHLRPPPADALPLMVAQLSRSSDPGARDLLARAVEFFGRDAKPYLPVLEQMLAEEKDPTVKENLVRAVDKLHSE